MKALKSLFTLTQKEFRSLFGEPALIVLILIVFTFIIANLAKTITVEVKNAPVGLVDLDRSSLSQRIQQAPQAPYFKKLIPMDREEANRKMDKGEIIFVLEIPPHFERDLLANRTPQIQLLIDATMMTQAGAGSSMLTQYINTEVSQFLKQSGSRLPLTPVVNTLYNPNANSVYFVPVMKIGDMMSMLVMILIGAAVIRERERGTMEHLLVMPVQAKDILLSKILANGIVIFIAAMISIKFVVQGFLNVPINGSIPLYAFGMVLFLFSIAALAVMLATIAPTMAQFSLLMLPIYMVLLLFSGSATPRINMPELAQAISAYWPSTVFADFSLAVLFRGAGIDIVWGQLLTMALISAGCLAFALIRFKSMLERQG